MLEVQHHSVFWVLALDEESVQLAPDHSTDDWPHLLFVCLKAEGSLSRSSANPTQLPNQGGP